MPKYLLFAFYLIVMTALFFHPVEIPELLSNERAIDTKLPEKSVPTANKVAQKSTFFVFNETFSKVDER